MNGNPRLPSSKSVIRFATTDKIGTLVKASPRRTQMKKVMALEPLYWLDIWREESSCRCCKRLWSLRIALQHFMVPECRSFDMGDDLHNADAGVQSSFPPSRNGWISAAYLPVADGNPRVRRECCEWECFWMSSRSFSSPFCQPAAKIFSN